MSREYPCIYYDNQLCKKFSQDGYKSWCVLGLCSHEAPSNAAIFGIVCGIFVCCMFIQWNTGRASSKLDDVLHILREIRDELRKEG